MGRNVRCLWQWTCRASLGWVVTLALVTSLSSTLSHCGQSRRTGIHPGVVASRAPKWNCRRSYNFSSLESDSQGSLSRLQVLHSSKALPAKPSTHFRPSQTLRGKARSPRKNDATHKPFSFREKQTTTRASSEHLRLCAFPSHGHESPKGRNEVSSFHRLSSSGVSHASRPPSVEPTKCFAVMGRCFYFWNFILFGSVVSRELGGERSFELYR